MEERARCKEILNNELVLVFAKFISFSCKIAGDRHMKQEVVTSVSLVKQQFFSVSSVKKSNKVDMKHNFLHYRPLNVNCKFLQLHLTNAMSR